MHRPCRLWTLKIETYGMVFHITDIPFKDIAQACAEGLKAKFGDKMTVKIYYAAHANLVE